MTFAIQIVVLVAVGIACALIANSRGRSPVGWFFIGMLTPCFGGLVLVLVLPDLKVQQERERRLADENRRLRERLTKERMVADERHAEISRRIVAHDVALGVDTGAPATQALPGPAGPARETGGAGAADPSWQVRSAQWFWAQGLNRQGPIDFATLQSHWRSGRLTADTLVWRKGMPTWTAVANVPALERALDG